MFTQSGGDTIVKLVRSRRSHALHGLASPSILEKNTTLCSWAAWSRGHVSQVLTIVPTTLSCIPACTSRHRRGRRNAALCPGRLGLRRAVTVASSLVMRCLAATYSSLPVACTFDAKAVRAAKPVFQTSSKRKVGL